MALPYNISDYAVTIAPGQSLSAALAMGADTLAAIAMPAAWIAATLTFQTSIDGGLTWLEVFTDAGTAVSINVTPGVFVAITDRTPWVGINMFRIRSGTLAAPVIQTNGATFAIVTAPMGTA